jgi:heptosyltransferase-3
VNAPLELPARPRILVVALRRLGDVLLTTPLIRSLRRAYKDARIEVLVFADTAAILAGNPDIDAVIECPQRPTPTESLALARRLFRRYDLAITTQASDRPSFFAIIAGKTRVGVTDDRLIGRIKGLFLRRRMPMREDLHRVEEALQLAGLIGIAPVAEVVAPRAERIDAMPSRAYAVLHAAPFFRYKQWHADGWRAVARHLSEKGLRIVATGGPAAQERAYLDSVFEGLDVLRLDGKLSWPELGLLLAESRVYVGPDTSVTHLAAAAGCPVVTMYGPTDPRRWGPWPSAGLAEPWASAGAAQRRDNVWLIQNPLPCMPCHLEGCLRHVESHSLCLDYLPVAPVLSAIEEVLGTVVTQGGAPAKRPLFNP